jgi:hypothetical protein
MTGLRPIILPCALRDFFFPHCLFYYPMPQAIIRIAKIKTKGAAQGKTKHNYRLMDTPNADPERTATLNQELVNTDRLDYWSLAEARIEEGIAKTARGKPRTVREDQVRAVEIVLTASPDWFKRGEDRQAEDVRGSQWVTDNLDFLKNKYGEKNVVSFTLHQDETTPHIHAVVIPLTEKGRLSADTLFNPDTLTQLQTDYAQAMAPHGLERGVEGSRRQHQDMKQVYGRQDQTAAELGPLAQPVATMPAQAVQLGEVPVFGRDTWRADEQARINAEIAQHVQEANQRIAEANKRAQEAVQYAIANAGSQEQAEVLSRQLNVSEGLKQGNFTQLQAEQAKVDDVAMRAAGGEVVGPELIKRGNELLDQAVQDVQQGRERVAGVSEKAEQAEKKGDYAQVAELRYGAIQEEEKRLKEQETNLRGYAGGAARLDQLDEQQAKERDEKAKKQDESERQAAEQARLDREAADQKRIDQANAATERVREEARQKPEKERQKPIIKENERQQIEEKAGRILVQNPHIYSVEHMDEALKRAGVDVWIVDSKRRMALTGSENEFTTADIRPGGKEISLLVGEQIKTNKAQFEREVARDNDRERD